MGRERLRQKQRIGVIITALYSFGRKNIYTLEPAITRDNLVSVLQKAVPVHNSNSADIRYLWNYYKGNQPNTWARTKKFAPR